MNWEQHWGKGDDWDQVGSCAQVSRRALHLCITGASEQQVHLCCSASSGWDFPEEAFGVGGKGFNFPRQPCLHYTLQEPAGTVNKPKSGYFDFSF